MKKGFVSINAVTGKFYVVIDGDVDDHHTGKKATKKNAQALAGLLAYHSEVQWSFGSQIDIPEAQGVPRNIRSIIEEAWGAGLQWMKDHPEVGEVL